MKGFMLFLQIIILPLHQSEYYIDLLLKT